MRYVANTLSLNKELKESQAKNHFMFAWPGPWCCVADLWIGTPTDRLIISRYSDGTTITTGRGRFERTADMKLIVINNDEFATRFIVLLYDENGQPVLPGGFVGIDVNHPGENKGAESFEMRFIGANFDEKIYVFGFCASDAGEPDTGVFIATYNRKHATFCYHMAKAAQRLHGNHERLKDFFNMIGTEKDYELEV